MTMVLIYLFGWDLNSDDQQKVSLNLQNLSLAWCSFQWQFLLIAQTRRMKNEMLNLTKNLNSLHESKHMKESLIFFLGKIIDC